VECLSRRAESTVREFKPQEIANTLWALAMACVQIPASLKSTVREFKPQNIANTLWSLATAGVQIPASLVECLSRRAEITAREFNPQNIANTLCDGVQISASLVECLCVARREHGQRVQAEDIANTLCAASVLETIPVFMNSALFWCNVLADVDLDCKNSSCQLQFFLTLQSFGPLIIYLEAA
jgi:hypothetical protein